MKVTIYTTNDCQFCKQEMTYLASKNIAFEEKNVQSNRDFLQEMLDVSNNFAGTPVTETSLGRGPINPILMRSFEKYFIKINKNSTITNNITIPTTIYLLFLSTISTI